MFNRLRNFWKLSREKSTLTDIQIEQLVEVMQEGDGGAEFLGEGTAEEFEEQTKRDKGMWGLFGTKK